MDEPLALIPVSAQPPRCMEQPARNALTLCGLGASGLIAIVLLAAGLPVASVGLLFASAAVAVGMGSMMNMLEKLPRRPLYVDIDDVVSPEARSLYRAIRMASDELERSLAMSQRLQPLLHATIERCRSSVELAGRIAMLANPLENYLFLHDAGCIRSELERLRARTEASSDDAAIGALSRATAARARQLATHAEITRRRDLICARLEVVRAEIDAFAATLAKLRAVDDEQVVLAGKSLADELEAARDDLQMLESAFETDLAA